MFVPKATPGKGEILIIDQIFGVINNFTVDIDNHKLRTSLDPNRNFGHMSYEEMIVCEKESWDVNHLSYSIDDMGNLEMDIPEGYEVSVILK